ncbi:MAG: type II secretion system F family protein [Candidatus Riflebacteria bacterium]|nr:type II secretion system F family protein [Candidatus Riflebacteria bacterium]
MNYHYKARTAEGVEIQGVVDAADERAATISLSQQGMFVTRVSLVSGGFGFNTEIKALTWIPASVFNAFLIQLAMLIRSGVSLTEALASLQTGETHRVFKKVLGDVLREVEQGRALSMAFGTHTEVFDPFFIGMIRLAETGGVLEKVLDKLSKISKRATSLRNQLIGALTYPALLVTVASLVMLLLFGYALPRFAMIFSSAKIALPLPTQILLAISNFTRANLVLLFCCLIGAIILAIITVLTQTGRWMFSEVALRLPFAGQVVQSYLVVHISETLALLLGAGVPLIELLLALENTLTMPTAKKLVENMRNYVERGSTIRLALEGNIVFPPMALKLIETGEKTGSLDRMFDEIAGFYDERLQESIRTALSVIEPMMIVVIAGIVGFIMLSIVMPIMEMSSLMGGGK